MVPKGEMKAKRCLGCGALHERRGDFCAARWCRYVAAEFWSYTIVTSIIGNARWAGAPSQEEMARRYYTQELREAVQVLAQDEGPLLKILREIMQDVEDIESGDDEETQLPARQGAA